MVLAHSVSEDGCCWCLVAGAGGGSIGLDHGKVVYVRALATRVLGVVGGLAWARPPRAPLTDRAVRVVGTAQVAMEFGSA